MQPRDLDFQHLFGQRVRTLRLQLHLTQDTVAMRCGIYRTYLARIEAGMANPTILVISALANALDVPVRELFLDMEMDPATALADPASALEQNGAE